MFGNRFINSNEALADPFGIAGFTTEGTVLIRETLGY